MPQLFFLFLFLYFLRHFFDLSLTEKILSRGETRCPRGPLLYLPVPCTHKQQSFFEVIQLAKSEGKISLPLDSVTLHYRKFLDFWGLINVNPSIDHVDSETPLTYIRTQFTITFAPKFIRVALPVLV